MKNPDRPDNTVRRTTMRCIGTLCLLLACLAPFRSMAAQPLINLSMKNAAVKEVIWAIEKQSKIAFVFNAEVLDKVGRISVTIRNQPVEQALQICLRDTPLTYVKQQSVIVIKRKETAPKPQTVVVSGLVIDKKSRKPMPGANVWLKQSTVGTVTGTDGRYTIRIPAGGGNAQVLVFGFLGMKREEVKFTGQTTLNVEMTEDANAMDDVVVTGYQTLHKRDVAGSYSVVKAEDIMMPAVTSIDQMLQGRVAGLMVTKTSARASGSTPDISIRGTSTIMGNTSPLWVVDGVIQPDPLTLNSSALMTDDLTNILGNQISWLNPSDIETITVLKDASATAIYGSKASNGVIVINTKQGEAGRVSIKYTGNVSIQQQPNYGMFNLMNSQERVRFSQEVFNAGSSYHGTQAPIKQMYTYEGLYRMYLDNDISFDTYRNGLARLETVNTDWLDLLTRSAVSHNHNVSVMGGKEKLTYNVSASYFNNQGVELKDESEQFSGRVRVGAQLHPKLRVDASIIGTMGTNTGYGPGVSPLDYATSTSRAIPAYEENGDRAFYQRLSGYTYGPQYSTLGYNILNEIDNSYSQAKTNRINATLNLDWNILPWMTYQFVGGVSNNEVRSETFAGERSYYIASTYRGYDYGTAMAGDANYKAAMLPFGGEFMTLNKTERNYNMQHKLLFQKTFREVHSINAMLGLEVRSTRSDALTNTVWGYIPDRGKKLSRPTLPSDFVSQSSSTIPAFSVLNNLYNGRWSNVGSEDNYFSYFFTFAYSYKNRYVFNASLRNDESNRFGQDVRKRFDPLYSFALSWDIAEEPFIKDNVQWINQFRLRGSYGVQGNTIQTISPDIILAQQGVVPGYEQYGVSISSLPNPNLTWESTKSWNIGMDMQIFRWVTMCLEYYHRASDAVIYQPIPREYGMPQMALNGGRIYNHGVEFTMNITPVRTEDFGWTVGMNVSQNWNEADRIDSNVTDLNQYLDGVSGRVLRKGYPLSAFWSYSFKGLNPETGYPEFNLPEGTEMDPTKFLVYSGEKNPYFTGGFNTRFRWKDLTFSADFSVILGSKKRLPNPFSTDERLPSPYTNLDRELLDRWKQPGDEERTSVPAFYSGKTDAWVTLPNGTSASIYQMWAESDLRVVDGSFLRCTQMALTWDIPSKWCRTVGLTNAQLSFNVNNVFVIADKRFNGFDPELGNSVMPRVFSLGVNIGF